MIFYCVVIHVVLYMCVQVYVSMYACMQKPENSVRDLVLPFSAYSFKTVSLIKPEITGSQQAPFILLSQFPITGITGIKYDDSQLRKQVLRI